MISDRGGLPAEAYAQIEKVIESDALKKQGVTVDKREPMRSLASAKAFFSSGGRSQKNALQEMALVASARLI